jgi:hypothetical protein
MQKIALERGGSRVENKTKIRSRKGTDLFYTVFNYIARVILPDLMQLVQTFLRTTVPSSTTLTDWIFAFHFLLVLRLE